MIRRGVLVARMINIIKKLGNASKRVRFFIRFYRENMIGNLTTRKRARLSLGEWESLPGSGRIGRAWQSRQTMTAIAFKRWRALIVCSPGAGLQWPLSVAARVWSPLQSSRTLSSEQHLTPCLVTFSLWVIRKQLGKMISEPPGRSCRLSSQMLAIMMQLNFSDPFRFCAILFKQTFSGDLFRGDHPVMANSARANHSW